MPNRSLLAAMYVLDAAHGLLDPRHRDSVPFDVDTAGTGVSRGVLREHGRLSRRLSRTADRRQHGRDDEQRASPPTSWLRHPVELPQVACPAAVANQEPALDRGRRRQARRQRRDQRLRDDQRGEHRDHDRHRDVHEEDLTSRSSRRNTIGRNTMIVESVPASTATPTSRTPAQRRRRRGSERLELAVPEDASVITTRVVDEQPDREQHAHHRQDVERRARGSTHRRRA